MASWGKVGALWIKEKGPDGAGNTAQYLLGSIKVGGKTVKFAAHPNPTKTDPTQPDMYIFVKPQGKQGAK